MRIATLPSSSKEASTFFFALIIALVSSRSNAFVNLPKPHAHSSFLPHTSRSQLHLANTNENTNPDNNDDLLQKALQLRKEAKELESKLERTRPKTKSKNDSLIPKSNTMDYTSLKNSCWELTYRFTKDPISNDNDTKEDKTEERPRPVFYSGKIQLSFREDGYTDICTSSDDDTNQSVTFNKAWGWDEEVSNEDDLAYILFSADLSLDNKDESTTKERFYFQARVDSDRQGILKLTDGTVTVKREVQRPDTGGKLFWGIFDGSGILAQFRNVGNFSCKSISCPQ